jgi:peptidoglycan LD-endopeptidase LytH
MNKVCFTLLAFSLILFSTSPVFSQNAPASQWNDLYPKIRDGLIPKEEARAKIRELEALLKEYYSKTPDSKHRDRLCFPLKGYTFQSIGGTGGSGYQISGYDFFDGNEHRGHPGHDIFIRDKNQDGLDDVTGKPVEVISAGPGIVVSVNLNWEPSSPVRGGNYVWIYDPVESKYFYYAHLNEVFVRLSQIVSPRDRLGTVGRTGLYACPKRSPTHLHFTVHQSKDGYPKPVNPYMDLVHGCKTPSPSLPPKL